MGIFYSQSQCRHQQYTTATGVMTSLLPWITTAPLHTWVIVLKQQVSGDATEPWPTTHTYLPSHVLIIAIPIVLIVRYMEMCILNSFSVLIQIISEHLESALKDCAQFTILESALKNCAQSTILESALKNCAQSTILESALKNCAQSTILESALKNCAQSTILESALKNCAQSTIV